MGKSLFCPNITKSSLSISLPLSVCCCLFWQLFCFVLLEKEKKLPASMLDWRWGISYIHFKMIYLTVSCPRVSYILYTYIFSFCTLSKSNTTEFNHFTFLSVHLSPHLTLSFAGPTDAPLVIFLSFERLCFLSLVSHTWRAAAYRRWFHKLASHFTPKIQFSPAEQRLFLEHL